jgi:hypothetical protein
MGRKAAARLNHKGKIYPHDINDERGVGGGGVCCSLFTVKKRPSLRLGIPDY